MRPLLAALVLTIAGCSIVDPGDRDELKHRIDGLPPSEISAMKKWLMNDHAIKWLKGKPKADQMGKLQCRVQAGGKWGDWIDQEPTYLVFDMLKCLKEDLGEFFTTYMLCQQQWESIETQDRETDLLNSHPVPGGASVQCKFIWDFRYNPETIPSELTDPDSIKDEDIINGLISLPAPPPGWDVTELVPLLCPLGAGPGWGCPGTPSDPGGGQPGDHQ